MLLHTKARASVLSLEATLYKCTFSDIPRLYSQTVCTVLIPDLYSSIATEYRNGW